jgi:4-hydroxythreonine-4-phosphate dehydrogenase
MVPIRCVGVTLKKIGTIDAACGEVAMLAIERAADAVAAGEYGALVTAPISKEAVNLAGYPIPGHTEFLAARAGVADVAMTLAGKELAVTVMTTHVAYKEVPALLTTEKINAKIRLIDAALKRYGIPTPRIAVAGLNPHASDGGVFGNEEATIITPAIKAARSAGIEVTGPYAADTMFAPKKRSTYDIALAMYHDQGLVAIKTLSFGATINITLGLPYLRVSVDHGTAFDIAGQGLVDPSPMVYAIKTAHRLMKGGWVK